MRALVLLAVPLAAWACGTEGPRVSLLVEELPSPAGEGSGEPFLSSRGDTVYLSWLESAAGGMHDLRMAAYADGAWTEPRVVASREDFFVNWADFPSVSPGPLGTLWAHWLQRGTEGGYDYGIRVVRSDDGGATWSAPWTPHEDGTPTEHGFVSTVQLDGALGFLWLDGRQFVERPGGEGASEEMALYFRTSRPDGSSGPETLVDARVCDCCQTDMALTDRGPVAVYRDRTDGEIRDIRTRRYLDGAWTEGAIVHDDGWETGACPVNGPAVAALDSRVVVAWFTAAGGVPHVKLAFSSDAGGTFDRPILVDDGNPAGRVDVLMLEDGAALVSWLERTGEAGAEVRARRVEPSGRMGEGVAVSTSSGERASGFPRLAAPGGDEAIVAWTDVTELSPRVRVARIQLQTLDGDSR